MAETAATEIQAPRRIAGEVMRLARMGSSFPTRLSFMRVLLRQLSAEKAQVTRPVWEIDDAGFGRAVNSVPLGGHVYSLVAFSTPLADENRTDRVIAEAWDTSYVLFDGVPTRADLDRLEANAPLQEAGRFSDRELVLCRANKSVRMFETVVAALARGEQPSADKVAEAGYLMRTTAVYGNGKFGISDRSRFATRPGLSGPFYAEMLAVWLVRGFTHDLVEHVAARRSPETAVPLDRALKRHFGIGNSTGLGMAPFLVSHPVLMNNWVMARETALARVRSAKSATPAQQDMAARLIDRVTAHLAQWQVPDADQMQRIETLRQDWAEIRAAATKAALAGPHPWARLVALATGKSLECQELMAALVLEPNGDLVDDLADGMRAETRGGFDPSQHVAAAKAQLHAAFHWALELDFAAPGAQKQFWYVSEEKLEPRLGDRETETGAELESPLDIARRAQAYMADLEQADGGESLASFLMRHPAHRFVARRAQIAARYPYSEIHDNLIAETCLPVDMLRFKLAFFGACKFDPKSDRWTRINMYQGAPLFDEITNSDADNWWLPVLEGL